MHIALLLPVLFCKQSIVCWMTVHSLYRGGLSWLGLHHKAFHSSLSQDDQQHAQRLEALACI